MGGQTGLNLSVELTKGILEKIRRRVDRRQYNSIRVGEDRELFKKAMDEIGIPCRKAGSATRLGRSPQIVQKIGYPAIFRLLHTGRHGGGTAFNPEEFEEIETRGFPRRRSRILIEESIFGWKEYELEVCAILRNVVIICSIENFDPDGRQPAIRSLLLLRKR